MLENPFQIGGQVYNESFIGRKELIEYFRKIYLESNSRTGKSIVGLTRIGKTSFIKNCFLEIPAKVIYIYTNLNEWSSYNEIWQSICMDIHDYLIEQNIECDIISESFSSVENSTVPWIKFSRAIKNIFEYLSSNSIRTILVLDEFDNASTLFNEGTKHFELFRTIFSDGKYDVSPITISRRNLYTIEGATYQSSTFHGVLDVVPFKGFNDDDMEEYFSVLDRHGVILNEDIKDKIVYYAGNAPYLLSILGYYIIEAASKEKEIDVDKIFLDKCKAINDYYRDCIKHLERDDDLRRIIPFIIGPNVGVTQQDKDEMYNLGYFRDENGELIVVSKYFKDFLSANMLNSSIWDNIISLEKKLKQLVDKEFKAVKSHYGIKINEINEAQEEILSKTPGITKYSLKTYEEYIRTNKKKFEIDSTYLDVMSMEDTVKIIKECWGDVFSKYFNNDLYSKWDSRFKQCIKGRNPVAHGHEEYLSDIEKQEIDVFCKQIFDTLSESGKTKHENADNTERKNHDLEKNALNDQGLTFDFPRLDLLGKEAKMTIERVNSQKNSIKGVLDGLYKAVVPKNYLIDLDWEKYRENTQIRVIVERFNNGQYEVKPIK